MSVGLRGSGRAARDSLDAERKGDDPMTESNNHGDCTTCGDIETDLCSSCRICLDCCRCECPIIEINHDELARLEHLGSER
jgi:hypothetical protein